jgi:hypothetical protein
MYYEYIYRINIPNYITLQQLVSTRTTASTGEWTGVRPTASTGAQPYVLTDVRPSV